MDNIYPVVVYHTVLRNQPKLDLNLSSAIAFTSPSTVDAFRSLYDEFPGHALLYVYGKASRRKLVDTGAKPQNIIEMNP